MTTLSEFRQKYPQYDDMSDDDLARALHERYYTDMSFDDYAKKIGHTTKKERTQNANIVMTGMSLRNFPGGPALQGGFARLPKGVQSRLSSGQRGMVQGGTLGFSDELAGGVAKLAGGSYSDTVDSVREQDKAARQTHPFTYFGGELVGGFSTGGAGVGRAAASAATRQQLARRAAASGAAWGGAAGFGYGEGGLLNRSVSTGAGAAGGFILGYASSRIMAGVGDKLKQLAVRRQFANNGQLSDEAISIIRDFGVDPDTLPQAELDALYDDVMRGINPGDSLRYRDANALPAPVPLSQGQITLDDEMLSMEELARSNMGPGHIYARESERMQQQALRDNVTAFRDQFGGSPAQYGDGGAAMNSRLAVMKEEMRKRADEAYKSAQSTDGAFIPRDNVEDYIRSSRAQLDNDINPSNVARLYVDEAESRFGPNVASETGNLEMTGPPISQRQNFSDGLYDIEETASIIRDLNKQAAGRPQSFKRPFTEYIKSIGGINPKSQLAGDLRAAGVRLPGLFNNKGGGVDNLTVSEMGDLAINFRAGRNGYAESNDIIDAIVREDAGEAVGGVASLSQRADAALNEFEAKGIPREGDIEKAIRYLNQRADSEAARVAKESEMQELYSIISEYDSLDDFTRLTQANGPAPRPDQPGVIRQTVGPPPVSLNKLEGFRQELIKGAKQQRKNIDGTTDVHGAALARMKRDLDNFIEKSLEEGLVSGDPSVIDDWKRARRLWSEYKDTFAGKTGAQRLVAKLANGEYDAKTASDQIFGAGRLFGKQNAAKTAEHLRDLLGADSFEWQSLRQEAFTRILKEDSGGNIGIKFANGLEDALTRDADAMRVFFNSDEILAMRRLARVVKYVNARSNAKANPSRTAKMQQAIGTRLGVITGTSSIVPFIGPIVRTLADAKAARNIRKQFNGKLESARLPKQ